MGSGKEGLGGKASRLGSIEPGEKTGLRLSPHLAPSTNEGMLRARAWPRHISFELFTPRSDKHGKARRKRLRKRRTRQLDRQITSQTGKFPTNFSLSSVATRSRGTHILEKFSTCGHESRHERSRPRAGRSHVAFEQIGSDDRIFMCPKSFQLIHKTRAR